MWIKLFILVYLYMCVTIQTFVACRSALHNNTLPVLHRLWDRARYWSKFTNCNLLRMHFASQLGETPFE